MKSDPGVVSSATEMQSDASPLAPGLGAGAGEGAGPGAGEGEGEGEGVGDGAGDGEGAGAGLGGGGVTGSSLPPQAVSAAATHSDERQARRYRVRFFMGLPRWVRRSRRVVGRVLQ